MKIGIYLAYQPMRGFSFVGEGIGRYTAMLIRLLLDRGNQIVIACPDWLLGPLDELFAESNIPTEHIEYASSPAPALFKMLDKLGRPKRKKAGLRMRLRRAVSTLGGRTLNALLGIKHIFTLVVFLGFALIGALVLAIVALPFMILIKLIGGCLHLMNRLYNKLTNKATDFAIGWLKQNPSLKAFAINAASTFRQRYLHRILMMTRDSVAKEMIARINHLRDKPDLWYTPSSFWAEFSDIKGIAVSCFPDLSTAVFAEGFSNHGAVGMTNAIRKNVEKGRYFIAYSDYQRDAMMVNTLGKDPAYVRTVPLFVNDMLPYVNVKEAYPKQLAENANMMLSRRLLTTLPTHAAMDTQGYWGGFLRPFALKDIKYIFYSSQARPNKNVMTLVRAYEYLLRKEEVDFKLVLTGSLDVDTQIKRYVYDRHLQYDIVSFSRVNNQQLAALYMCAELVVNPTLYEGGFLMIFSEGMSVGTPSVMSRIPQVTDIVTPYDMDDCLFDPTDHMDIAEKILYGIENREALIEKQKPLYEELAKWCKERAGRDYEEAFEYFIALDNQKKAKRQGKGMKIECVS